MPTVRGAEERPPPGGRNCGTSNLRTLSERRYEDVWQRTGRTFFRITPPPLSAANGEITLSRNCMVPGRKPDAMNTNSLVRIIEKKQLSKYEGKKQKTNVGPKYVAGGFDY